MQKIWLSTPHMGEHEIDYVNEAFSKNQIFPLGDFINQFESKLLSTINFDKSFSVALNSGTSAIHLALKIIGVKNRDEVICSSFTFSASANPILYEGGIPVFVDSEKDTWNMCPRLLEQCIQDRIARGKKPKAIIVVHLYGMPAKINEIIVIANHYKIPVIEDAAEALGSKFNDEYLGTLGEIGIFSFNGNKIITTSAGGALVSKSKKDSDLALKYATQSREPVLHYQHNQVGYNYRMSNVLAAIGVGQLEVLEDRVSQRRSNFEFYKKKLNNSSFEFLEELEGNFSNRWLTTMLCNRFDPIKLIEYLAKKNIETRPLWKPLHLQPFFKKQPKYLNGTSEELYSKGICLPSSSSLTIPELEFVTDNILKFEQSN